MNAASIVLIKQFSELPPLQNTLILSSLHLAEEGSFTTTFVSTGPCLDLSDGKVHLYDSMQPEHHALAIIKQLHSLYVHLTNKNKIEIILPQVLSAHWLHQSWELLPWLHGTSHLHRLRPYQSNILVGISTTLGHSLPTTEPSAGTQHRM